MLPHTQTRRRRGALSARNRARGFTLVETAISGIVVAGITAGLLLAVRYSQMVSEGKAVGQQMTAISEGANRYMKQYSQQILGLDARCAESTLEIDEGGSRPPPPSQPAGDPACRLVLGSVTVANGFQPTVKELQALELLRANDALMLPFSPGITVDKRTGEAAVARIAVAIRPVRHQTTVGDPSSTGGTTGGTGGATPIPAAFVPGINNSLGGPTFSFDGFNYKLGTDADRDLPPTINGVSCYFGSVTPSGSVSMLTRVFVDSKDDLKVLPIYTSEEISAALNQQGAYRSFQNGKTYCRYLQQRYGMGLITGSGTTSGGGTPGTGGGGGNAWTLESVVFNTQPYYFGASALPMGAAAQMGAALQEAGYAGRMSMLKGGMAESKTLRGLYGHSQSDNPIRSKDGARGLPGILAAVTLLADTQASNGSAGTAPNWDAAGNNISNAGVIQGRQIATNSAVFGSGETINTRGREATLAVQGNMVLGKNSVLMAASVEADGVQADRANARAVETANLRAPGVEVAGATAKLGLTTNAPYNFYLRNGTKLRMPRVEMGSPCATYGDIGVSRALSIQRPGGILFEVTRFIAICKPDFIPDSPIGVVGSQSTSTFRTSTWSSPEYEALAKKYPKSTYEWVWFDSSYADRSDHEPTL